MSASTVVGQQNFTSNSGDQGGSAGANTLEFPYGVATNGTKFAVADYSNNRVLIYDSIPTANNASATVVIGQTNFSNSSANQGGSRGANTLSSPIDVEFAGEKLLIMDYGNSRVLIYNTVPTTNNASANTVIGQVNFSGGSANQGNASPTDKTLNNPYGIDYDETTGKLFIADTNNNRVLIYNSVPTTDNASADVVVGQANFTTRTADQGGAAGANTLDLPFHTIIVNSKLIASDGNNNRVLIYNTIPITNNASANVVIGQTGMTGTSADQGGSVDDNTLNFPTALATDGTQLFIGDSSNYRLLGFSSVPTSNNASADIVIGQPDFTSNDPNQGGSPNANTFEFLDGDVLWYSGKLIVADTSNSRVLIFIDPAFSTGSGTSDPPPPGPAVSHPPGCDAPPPLEVPHLFQTLSRKNEVTLYFVPTKDNTTGYVVTYGFNFDRIWRFGTEINWTDPRGVMVYTIRDLQPNTRYILALRSQNRCAPGNWGNTIVFKTLGARNNGARTTIH